MTNFSNFTKVQIQNLESISGGAQRGRFIPQSINLPGMALRALHATAEFIVKASGIGPVFKYVDAAVIHPILWTPLSILTDYPIDTHPTGVESAAKVFRRVDNVTRGLSRPITRTLLQI